MKPDEVIDILRVIREEINFLSYSVSLRQRWMDAISKAIKAFEKQKPMKPDITLHNWHCGNCHNAWGRERVITESHSRFEYFQYCPTCGQRIDWGDAHD